MDKPPFNAATGKTPRVHPGLSLRRDMLEKLRAEMKATRPGNLSDQFPKSTGRMKPE